MKSGIGAANSDSSSFEMTVHNGSGQMVSQRIGKNKIALFACRSSLFLQLRLMLLLFSQKEHYGSGGGDHTTFSVFTIRFTIMVAAFDALPHCRGRDRMASSFLCRFISLVRSRMSVKTAVRKRIGVMFSSGPETEREIRNMKPPWDHFKWLDPEGVLLNSAAKNILIQ